MSIFNFSRATNCGLILAGLYSIFFCATFLSWALKGSWDAQIAVAFVSAPASALILGSMHHLLLGLGEYGSANREIAVWLILFTAGFIQYFALGFFAVKLWFSYTSERK